MFEFDTAKLSPVCAINLHRKIFLVRIANYVLNLFAVRSWRKHLNILPEGQDKGFQLVVGYHRNFDYPIVKVHNPLGLMKCLRQHIRKTMFRELKPNSLRLSRENTHSYDIVQIRLKVNVGGDVSLVHLLQILNSVQRYIVYGMLLFIETEKEPTVVVFFDVIRMDGPIENLISKGFVLNMKDSLIDNGVKQILEPVESCIGLNLVVADNTL